MSTPRRITGSPAARDQPGQRRRQAAVVGGRGQLAGDDQAPGGGVDEQRAAAAEMRAPVAVGDLVADQRVAGGGVGNAQQRLGEAHQRHAFLARQRIFLHQPLDAGALVLGAQRRDQLAGGRLGAARGHRRRQRGGLDQRRQAFGFRPAIGGGDRLAQRRLRARSAGRNRQREQGAVGGLCGCGWLIDIVPFRSWSGARGVASKSWAQNRVEVAAYPSGKIRPSAGCFTEYGSFKPCIIRCIVKPGRTIRSQSRTFCDSLWRAIRHSSSPGMQVRQTIGRTA